MSVWGYLFPWGIILLFATAHTHTHTHTLTHTGIWTVRFQANQLDKYYKGLPELLLSASLGRLCRE
jgi:hypothetical protein